MNTQQISSQNAQPKKSGALNRLAEHNVWFVLLSLLAALFLWSILVKLTEPPAYLLPSPLLVWNKFLSVLMDGSLLRHSLVTLVEVLAGLLCGSLLATCMGYFLAKSIVLEKMLSPYLIASQAIPTIAIAPLLIIWFGPGLFSKVLICTMTVFFPILVNTIIGIRAVPENLRDLMQSMNATRMQKLRLLEIPAALPILFGGLRIGATLSVIGAVVGEFVGSDKGLGFLVNVGRGQYDTALVFVSIFALIFMALVLYSLALIAEKRSTRWKTAQNNKK